jgi:hypothetical protein
MSRYIVWLTNTKFLIPPGEGEKGEGYHSASPSSFSLFFSLLPLLPLLICRELTLP